MSEKNLLEGREDRQFKLYLLASIKLLQYAWSCVHLKLRIRIRI